MTYQIIEKNHTKYILLDTIGKQNDTHKLLIQGERLSDDFLRLSTGVAGAILQKFVNYGIKAVIVLDKSCSNG